MVHPDIFDQNGECKGRLRNIGHPSEYYFPFGKYKNKTYAFVSNDTPYLRWVLSQDRIMVDYPFLCSYFSDFIYNFDM